MHPSESKAQLRASIKERLARYPKVKRAAESRSLSRRILEALPAAPVTICGYVPLSDEADIRLLLRELLTRGDHLFLPRFQNGILTFGRVIDLADLKPGALDIPEPPEHAEAPDLSRMQIVLVPGRAFDRKGNRIGRGNGGYDKWIADVRALGVPSTPEFWGIALECQIVESIPTEPHDQRMDAIVTARGLASPEK